MGCTGSRDAHSDRQTINNATSSHKYEDSNGHSVTRTSPTLGSLLLKHEDYVTSDDELLKKASNICKTSTVSIDKMASIPRTPTKTPTDEPETIDTWELMEGLEGPLMSDSDPESLKYRGIVKARIAAFQEKIDEKRTKKCPSNGENKVVLYFTSLRGIRRTYEDCSIVKVILQGYNVKIDERDVSMHSGFKEELNEILGVGFGRNRLPSVFADGIYLGGVDEIKRMHDDGELEKILEEFEMLKLGKRGRRVCEGCGDIRFVPCETCYGSCKVFVQAKEVAGGFRRCPDCNENGLVQCRICL